MKNKEINRKTHKSVTLEGEGHHSTEKTGTFPGSSRNCFLWCAGKWMQSRNVLFNLCLDSPTSPAGSPTHYHYLYPWWAPYAKAPWKRIMLLMDLPSLQTVLQPKMNTQGLSWTPKFYWLRAWKKQNNPENIQNYQGSWSIIWLRVSNFFPLEF